MSYICGVKCSGCFVTNSSVEPTTGCVAECTVAAGGGDSCEIIRQESQEVRGGGGERGRGYRRGSGNTGFVIFFSVHAGFGLTAANMI